MSMLSSMLRSGLVLSFCSGLVFNGLCPKLQATQNDNNNTIKAKVYDFFNKKGMALVRTGLVCATAWFSIKEAQRTYERKLDSLTLEDIETMIAECIALKNLNVYAGIYAGILSSALFLNSNEEGLEGWAKFGVGTVLGGALSAVASVKFADQVKSVLPPYIAGFYNPIALTAAGALIGGLTQFVKNPFAKESNKQENA